MCNGLQPDLTLLLLPPLEVSLRRARRRNQRHIQSSGTDENRFERESDEFYRLIYSKYEEIAARETMGVVPLREDASLDSVERSIYQTVASRLASGSVASDRSLAST